MKLKKTVIYVQSATKNSYSLCFTDESNELIFELKDSAFEAFSLILQDKDPSDDYLKIFNDLGLMEGSSPKLKNLDQESLKTRGIEIRNIEDLYTAELEAHGFTTLTATNCSSYCDCS